MFDLFLWTAQSKIHEDDSDEDYLLGHCINIDHLQSRYLPQGEQEESGALVWRARCSQA